MSSGADLEISAHLHASRRTLVGHVLTDGVPPFPFCNNAALPSGRGLLPVCSSAATSRQKRVVDRDAARALGLALMRSRESAYRRKTGIPSPPLRWSWRSTVCDEESPADWDQAPRPRPAGSRSLVTQVRSAHDTRPKRPHRWRSLVAAHKPNLRATIES
jgi:hypothetical protein